jgi:hypothetical protein
MSIAVVAQSDPQIRTTFHVAAQNGFNGGVRTELTFAGRD